MATEKNKEQSFDIFDNVSHVNDGTTGVVRAIYFIQGEEYHDVETADEWSDIVYHTPAKNWKKVSGEDYE